MLEHRSELRHEFLSPMILLSVLLLVLLPECLCYNSEAPLETCVSMLPGTVTGATGGGEGHTAPTQNESPLYGNSEIAPYTIEVNGAIDPPTEIQESGWLEVIPGMSYQVRIVSDQTQGSNIFKGILLMARQLVCYSNSSIHVLDEPVGTFSVGTGSLLKTIACNQIPNSAISHKSPQYKISEQATWTAPANQRINVIFRATIVQSVNVYWTDVYSRPLHIRGSSAPVLCSSVPLHTSPLIYAIVILTVLWIK